MALTLHPLGTSTPSCSKATAPVAQLVMRASRRSQVTVSYGSDPGVVKWRLMPMPVCSVAIAIWVPSLRKLDSVGRPFCPGRPAS